MAVPLTITVHVAEAIRKEVDGRQQVNLGVPSTASVGDVLESLFKLYPKLVQHMASERRSSAPQGLRLVMASSSGRPASMQQGQRLYLFGAPPRKGTPPRG